jgi:hypothetical protein
MALPYLYIDNVNLFHVEAVQIRDNRVYDCYSNGIVVGIHTTNLNHVRVKDNRVARIRSVTDSLGMQFSNCTDVLLQSNVISRVQSGVSFNSIGTLNVYNLTVHNAQHCIESDSAGTFRNIVLSTYQDSRYYKSNYGFYLSGGAAIDLDYCYYMNLGQLAYGGTVTSGTNVEEKNIIYMDEPNDDLTPDYISELDNAGTQNTALDEANFMGGIKSPVTNEVTAGRNYFYELIDETFWDVDNPKSGEYSFIRAFQSRFLASAEVAERQMERDLYLKQLSSLDRFTELFPMYEYYASGEQFRKRVMDLWFATTNPATLSAYNASIGGYNLHPSFFMRMEDYSGSWIIGESYIDYDNWLLGYEGTKYGIFIDVLGVSTLSHSASAECYNNTMKSVADLAPVSWFLHEEQQPTDYFLFVDNWNHFEDCALTNAIYNEQYCISAREDNKDIEILTPAIPVDSIAPWGVSTESYAPSGDVEISLFDRIYSENLIRKFYYRQGSSLSWGAWTEIVYPIGGTFTLTEPYVQFRITVQYILNIIDYELVGFCLRPYAIARDFTQT